MADLETAASEAVERIQRLTGELGLANEALDKADQDTERLLGEVAAAVEESVRAAGELTSRLESETPEIAREAGEAESEVSSLATDITNAAGALQAARGTLGDALSTALGTVTTADGQFQGALSQLTTILESLRQRAGELTAKLNEVEGEVEAFMVQQLPQELDAAETRVKAAADAAKTAADDAVAEIQAQGDAFAADVAELKSEIEAAFDQAPAIVKTAVDDAITAYLGAQRSMLEGLAQKSEWIVETLEATERAITDNDLDELADQAATDSQAVLDGLRQIIALYRAATEHCAQYELEGSQQALSQLPA